MKYGGDAKDGDDAKGGVKQKETERVYCNASKQFLIFSPPLILTLHLKRFHQTLAGPKKVTRHVVFPLELDLAPFCSATALALPNLAPGQNKVG
jgi:ubiquitin carboxyl-terminal hydrolase 16/45